MKRKNDPMLDRACHDLRKVIRGNGLGKWDFTVSAEKGRLQVSVNSDEMIDKVPFRFNGYKVVATAILIGHAKGRLKHVVR